MQTLECPQRDLGQGIEMKKQLVYTQYILLSNRSNAHSYTYSSFLSLIFLLCPNHSPALSPDQIPSILALSPKPTPYSHHMSHERKIRQGNLVFTPNHQRILFLILLIRLNQSFKPLPSSSLLSPYANVSTIALCKIHLLILPKSFLLLLFKLQAMVRQYEPPNHL
ncbi:hypothetical protein K435DRAFT_782239 [Dendrothele bispora CBS 962.96]|uniref:Uncharacterized protein n=1 Tax=Dendrothele bispora (strain CBS 962.96) TaxID=1314807 RepID=A0A4S8LG54_DENBC|nr:hypothetical protein K435DRAFT_782239 [Dendrothele bispora CBS 962.96]